MVADATGENDIREWNCKISFMAMQRIFEPAFPRANHIPFADFESKYHGQSCIVVGRGPTEFDYADLGQTNEPVFFINDAVCLEKYARGETFFFAHDPQALAWLDGQIRAIAVIPIDGKIFRSAPGRVLHHAGQISFYHWREHERETLLLLDREQIADLAELYTHTGTIHSLLHFVWFCGFTRVTLIGCDGITDVTRLGPKFQQANGYDPRLENRSASVGSPTYPAIFHAQQLLIALLGLHAVYAGTPQPH